MIALAPAWVLLAGAVAAHVLAFRAWRRGSPGAAMAWLLAGALMLRLYPALDGFLHAWDERFHALVAKNLMAHPLKPTLYEDALLPYDYRQWPEAHVWLHKPPLAMWLMALSMRCLGVGELALRLPSLLLSTAAVFATYRIGLAWKGKEVGLLAAFFQSVNAFLVLVAAGWFATDHVDTAVVSLVDLGVMTAVVAGPTAWGYALVGLVAGLAMLSKSFPGSLPLVLAPLWHGGRLPWRALTGLAALATVVCVLVVSPWQIYSARAFPAEAAWEAAYGPRHFVEALEGHGGSPLYHLAMLPKTYGELIYLPLAWFAYRFVRGERGPGERALAVWIGLPYAVFSLAVSKMPGYVMIAAPAVFLVEAAFCLRLRAAWGGSRRRRIGLGLLLAALLATPLRILINDLRLLRPHERHPAWVAELKHLADRLAGRRAVIFGSERPIETMFYVSQPAYPFIPDRATVEALRQQGRLVLVYAPREGRASWPAVEYLDPLPRPAEDRAGRGP